MWLTSFDPSDQWPPTEVTLLSRVRVGTRDDLAWAELGAPIRHGKDEWTTILLGSRHVGFSVWEEPAKWPVHVYVCTTREELQGTDELIRPDITIEAWGLLHETLERAALDQF